MRLAGRVTTAQQPFKSHTWLAAMRVLMIRDGGDFTRTSRLGPARFEHAVRKELIGPRGPPRATARAMRWSPRVYPDVLPSGTKARRKLGTSPPCC